MKKLTQKYAQCDECGTTIRSTDFLCADCTEAVRQLDREPWDTYAQDEINAAISRGFSGSSRVA